MKRTFKQGDQVVANFFEGSANAILFGTSRGDAEGRIGYVKSVTGPGQGNDMYDVEFHTQGQWLIVQCLADELTVTDSRRIDELEAEVEKLKVKSDVSTGISNAFGIPMRSSK